MTDSAKAAPVGRAVAVDLLSAEKYLKRPTQLFFFFFFTRYLPTSGADDDQSPVFALVV